MHPNEKKPHVDTYADTVFEQVDDPDTGKPIAWRCRRHLSDEEFERYSRALVCEVSRQPKGVA